MKNHLTELYTTNKGKAFQCDLTNSIVIEFKGHTLRFSVTDFMTFRRRLRAIDIHKMVFDLSDDFDFVNLEHIKSQLILKLTLCDLIQLRDLLDGAKFSLELVSTIHEILGDYSVIEA